MDKNKIIEQLYLEHKDHVYNFLARIANDPDLAMDVTQQTFMKALSDKNFAQVNNPKAYLFTIARNTLYNEFKRKKASSLDAIEEAGEFEAVDENEAVHETTELHDLQNKIESSIKRMPAKVKELMILRYTEDLSIKEIAAVTGRNLSDVKVNLHRARIKFESSFTNEMYAKVAASRDQCETLANLLAPYQNRDIPEENLQHVEKHITNCKICSEDAEQLKRSRTLFNLGALITAPYILDKMMSEAMASEINFLTGTGSSNSTAASTAAQSVTTKIIASKLISSKVAVMIGFVTILGIGGYFVLNNLKDNDKEIIATVNPPVAPVITPKTPTPPPAPTPANKVKPAPAQNVPVKIDPDATTIVSFKARNNKTGQFIFTGLKWDIYNTADSSGKSNTSTPKLIQTSTTPNFNVILDAGYYLAKVTYQGKTKESKFVVKDDNPVNVEIAFGKSASTQLTSTIKTKLPNIHIRRKETGNYISKPLKAQWDLCVLNVNNLKDTRARLPQAWAIMKQDIKESNPEFNLDRGLAPEPDWTRLNENYEDEYFSGDKYALYKNGSTYEVSENGSCKVVKTDYKNAEIDNGKHSYTIDFKNKTADQYVSGVIIRHKTDATFKNMAKNNPFQTRAMGKMLGEAMLGKAGSAQEQKSKDAIKQLGELTKVAGTETVLGESCEYTVMGEQMATRICYWKTMHEYPTIMARPIVLKSSVDLKIAGAYQIATVFEKDIQINDEIFSVPGNIKIRVNKF